MNFSLVDSVFYNDLVVPITHQNILLALYLI